MKRLLLRSAVAALLGAGSALFWRCLPEPLFDAPVSATLHDRGGRLLGAHIADDGQWRFPAPARVPQRLAQALIAAEDKRFHLHPGVDPLALARALRLNLSRGHVVSGASTLTMQAIRLARGNPPRTLREKAIESILALRLELRYGKEEILALYAGHAPFGGNVVGIEAAAWRYFGRAPEHLSWAEAATLAVLPNSPALIHPGRGRAGLQRKRDALLQRLRERGVLTSMDHQLALNERLPDAPQPLPRLAPHLLETLMARAPSEHRFSTTLDRGAQLRLNQLLAARVREYAAREVHNAAALVIDNRSLEVLAYAGNAIAPVNASEELGYSVDVVTRPRSTGSLLKPFLFTAMVQDGSLQPGALVPDVPTHFMGFRPENFDKRFRGAVRARDALAQSLNVPAVHMLRQYGIGHFHDLLRHMGMSTLSRPPDDYGLTLILGGAEGSLWELAQMYANLARIAQSGLGRGGSRYGLLRVRAGEVPTAGSLADYGAGAAWLTLEALQEVSRPDVEQHWKSFVSSRKVAWKTGTSFGQRDGWAIGVTPAHTVAVWIGNASGEGRAGLTGASMAAPLLFDVLGSLPDSGWFRPPLAQLRQVQVCRSDGYLPSNGCATEPQWVPAESHFQTVSRNQRLVHLDPEQRFQVDGRCQSVGTMVHRAWFVLPPAQEYYYRLHDAAYRSLPPRHPGCGAADRAIHPFEIVYPEPGSAVYVPTELGGTRGRVVFEAIHRDPDSVLYWHLDDRFLAHTTRFHKQALDLAPGVHRLVVVDAQGFRQVRRFEVLGLDEPAPGL